MATGAAIAGAVLLGLLILCAVFAWPGPGIRRILVRRRELHRRALLEDSLKYILACGRESREATAGSMAAHLHLSDRASRGIAAKLESAGLVTLEEGRLRLTAEGEKWAVRVVRAHRLWETWLADEAQMPARKVHGPAERIEHTLTAEQIDELDAHLGHPRHDPHGHPIPKASGEVPPLEEVTPPAPVRLPSTLARLSDLKPGEEGDVVVLDSGLRGFTRRRLLDLGLTAGSRVRSHLANAFGDPLAYRVRGTTIALRKEQASKIWVARTSRPAREARAV